MIKKMILPLLLSLGMVSSLALNPVTVHAEEKGSGIVTNKTVSYEEDGSYTITLESYATGEVKTSEVTKDVPTDIILVLDLSSSMTEPIGTVKYTKYSSKTNEELYDLRYNGGEKNLWYEIPGTSNYASVSVTKEGESITYESASSKTNGELYENNRNNLYVKMDDESYVKVSVDESGGWKRTYTYTYTYNGQKTTKTSNGRNNSPGIADLYLATKDNSSAVYTYSYTDSKGKEIEIETSTGGSVKPEGTFYSRSTDTSGGGSRLDALTAACKSFADAVAKKAAAAEGKEAVDHRIAVVGFNSTASLYIGSSTSTEYGNAFQDMSTDTGKGNVEASIKELKTGTGTNANLGMDLANTIFNNNPVEKGETRNRVVIFFTDGAPGTSGSDYFDVGVADKTITAANTSRDTYGATVYSIAVIAGADPESAGARPEKSGEATSDMINWYLQNVSSNKDGKPQKPSHYLAASDADDLKNIFEQIAEQTSEGGSESKLNSSAVVKDIISPYFTLPAGTSASDISIKTYKCVDDAESSTGYGFEGEDAGTGGASASIDADGNVSVTGFDFSEKWCGFETSTEGVRKVREGGYKLVISFKVQPKDGFLGGNNVPTNGDTSGVYENEEAETAVENFTVPKANVTIGDVDVTAKEKNVYLLGSVTKDQLVSGATVTVGADARGEGGITLNLSKADDEENPYGLKIWQSEYVNITVTIKDENGKEISESDLRNLEEDKEYRIEVKVSPKKESESESVGPEASSKSNSETKGNPVINVFQPQLTFKDGTAYYGEAAWKPEQYDTNCKVGETVWKHEETSSTDSGVEMIPYSETEEIPTLSITYTPDSTKLYDRGTKFGKSDVPVKAETKIGAAEVTEYTTFVHTPCPEDSGCGWEDPSEGGDPAFLVHCRTCTLTVTKAGDDALLDNGSYVFTVKKDGEPYSEVSIQSNSSQTLSELPVGTYTIAEDTGWSWRYSASPAYSDGGNGVALSSANPSGTITCTNTREKVKWLDGYSTIVRNVFRVGNSGSAGGADTK